MVRDSKTKELGRKIGIDQEGDKIERSTFRSHQWGLSQHQVLAKQLSGPDSLRRLPYKFIRDMSREKKNNWKLPITGPRGSQSFNNKNAI